MDTPPPQPSLPKPPKTALSIILAISIIPAIIIIAVLLLFILPDSFISSSQNVLPLFFIVFAGAFVIPFAIIARAIEKRRIYQLFLKKQQSTPPPSTNPPATSSADNNQKPKENTP